MTSSIQLQVIGMHDALLQQNISRMSQATGRTVKEQTRAVFKGMVRDALAFTPPGRAGATGRDAQRVGEAAISRDLQRIGFVPVTIKGFRMVTMAYGHPIAPVKVKTKEIYPTQESVDAIHRERLSRKHGGRVTRGRAQAYYVRRAYLTALKTRLFKEIGTLASWLVPAARTLGVPVPAWIARHGESGRGTQLQVIETQNKISMRVRGHFPPGTEKIAAQVQRLIDFAKRAAIGRLQRQLPFILRKNVRAAKRN